MNNQHTMKDKDGQEIKVGSMVKRCGFVRYADGPRYKVSKKTWLVSKIEDGLFYKDENGNDVKLGCKEGIEFLVVGDEKGFFKEHAAVAKVVKIDGGGVGQKYRVHGDIPAQHWKDGEIVLIHGNVSKETIDSGKLELVPDSVEHKHVLIVVDPVRVKGVFNKQ